MFEHFLRSTLPSFVEQIKWVSQRNFKQADAAILGLGLNGHIAFHEPELPETFSWGEVKLSEQTKKSLEMQINFNDCYRRI